MDGRRVGNVFGHRGAIVVARFHAVPIQLLRTAPFLISLSTTALRGWRVPLVDPVPQQGTRGWSSSRST